MAVPQKSLGLIIPARGFLFSETLFETLKA